MTAPATTSAVRPAPGLRRLAAQFGHAARSLLRSIIAAVFTFAMPIAWLVMIGFVAGNAVIDESTGLRVMQFATPSAIAMGAFFATFPAVAVAVGEARERLILKRLRATPMSGWAYVSGQVGAATAFGVASVGATVALATAAYGVSLPAASVGPFIVTVLVALMSFCALGMAVASIATSARLAEVASIGTAVVLSFISGVFVIGTGLPGWVDSLADLFPLKPFLVALQHQFDPASTGPQWALRELSVIMAWGVIGALVSILTFRWQPRVPSPAHGRTRPPPASAELSHVARERVTRAPVPSRWSRIRTHAAADLRTTVHRPGDLFFSVVIPVGLFLLLVTIQGNGIRPDGIPVATFTAASMATWGVAVVAFMNTAESFARARERGILKRLNGTPSGFSELVVGRGVGAAVVSLFIVSVVVTAGLLVYGDEVPLAGLLLGFAIVIVGVVTLAACAYLLAALVASARAVGAVSLLMLFVLAFFSDVFLIESPAWMDAVGAAFPLAHLQHALVTVWAADAAIVPWVDVAVLLAWAAAAGGTAMLVGRRHRT
jgi:ABC-type multidrug transport system permease subunit